MEYYYSNRSRQIPAFGSWDCYGDGDLPYTQCFETVHQTVAAGFVHYTYPHGGDGDEDLYVAGDLYSNDVVTRPAMILVPRQRRKAKVELLDEKVENNNNEDGKGKRWEMGDLNCKEPQSPIIRQKKNPKPVDEDLYKISPHLLYAKTNKKRKGLSFFSCWMLPSCGL